MNTILITAGLALLPISELRGAIPFALGSGLPLVFTYFFAVFLNALVGPIVYLFLSTIHRIIIRFRWYKSFFDLFVERNRHKVENKIKKYGYAGITLFVAIPLPVTGAYTGTLVAWLMGLDAKKHFSAFLPVL